MNFLLTTIRKSRRLTCKAQHGLADKHPRCALRVNLRLCWWIKDPKHHLARIGYATYAAFLSLHVIDGHDSTVGGVVAIAA